MDAALTQRLSPLEDAVIRVLWKSPGKALKVRDIHAKLKGKFQCAVSSVAVILDRLHTLGLVSRDVRKGRGGVHYLYSASTSKGEFETSVVAEAVDKLVKQFGPAAVSYFNERFAKKR